MVVEGELEEVVVVVEPGDVEVELGDVEGEVTEEVEEGVGRGVGVGCGHRGELVELLTRRR